MPARMPGQNRAGPCQATWMGLSTWERERGVHSSPGKKKKSVSVRRSENLACWQQFLDAAFARRYREALQKVLGQTDHADMNGTHLAASRGRTHSSAAGHSANLDVDLRLMSGLIGTCVWHARLQVKNAGTW